ncbi:hypothetical protein AB1Y20_007212 [Prymnesium parvum]|uniref:AB hydrolase-1 domain-containing protein n=1 Tax=Prymnesium parvum TaxID=97485 RepID=A0AB34IX13_PRYPA
MRLHTHVVGAPSSAAPPLVFVHGWPDDSRCWQPLLPAFASRRCVLVDLPRCDGAEWRGEDLSFSRLADLLAAALREERRGATVVAHDWGAFVAALVLARAPSLLHRLVLLDVGALPRFSRHPTLFPRALAIASYQAVNALIYALGRAPPLTPLADALNRRWVPLLLPAEEWYDRPVASEVNYFYFHAPSFLLSAAYEEMRAALHAPAVPLLFLYGSGYFHDRRWEEMLASPEWPDCDARRVAPGHWFFRSPQGASLTSAAINEWLCRTESPGRS